MHLNNQQKYTPCRKTMIYVLMIPVLCIGTMATTVQGQLPTQIPPVAIPGTAGKCPSDSSRQASRSFLQNATREITETDLNILTIPSCGPGNWRRVFYLNASRSDQTCPGQWNLVTSPVRGCAGADSTCRSAFSDDIFMAYSRVCGRITGEGTVPGTPDAFIRFSIGQNFVKGNYLDGVSVTHGGSGSRTHIWSFGAGHPGVENARCPCDNSRRDIAPLPPAEVGDNYFCDRADGLDPLWTGESCASDNPCCSFHNPPYFSVQLPAATTDRIELRICIDEPQTNEQVLVLFAEIYVQ